MEFCVLGPVGVRAAGRGLPAGGPRQRAVLAVLLLRANEPVPAEQLVQAVWDEPPPAAESNLRTYLARLRKVLASAVGGGPRLARDRGGHRLAVHSGELDLAVFEALAATGDSAFDAGDHRAAAGAYGRALALFRGEPLAGVARTAVLAARAVALAERRYATTERRFTALLALGRHDEVLPELRAQLARTPEREGLIRLLMLALNRAGHREEALAAYRSHRDRLAARLGVDPGAALTALYEQLTAGSAAPPVPVPGSGPVAAFRQLPPDIADFTGRGPQLRRVLAGLTDSAAPTVTVTGMGGVGKTRLAVRAARSAASAYPDGQLYADLRGHDPERAPPPSRPPCWRACCACSASTAPPSPAARPHAARCSANASPAGAYSSCSTTPRAPSRYGRCCPACPAAAPSSPAAASSTWPAPSTFRSACSPTARRCGSSAASSVSAASPRSRTRSST